MSLPASISIPRGYRPLSDRMSIRRSDKVPDLDRPGKWRAVKPHEIGWIWHAPHFISRPFVRKVRATKRAARVNA